MPLDEFAWIDRLRRLTRGDPRALNLMDDAAVLPSRLGFDLVISTDAMVEGVHFLSGEATDIVARRLLRTSLSDLAAKAAEPFGYFLNVAWPARFDDEARNLFIQGLDQDGREFGVVLLGGDTVGTPGPMTLDATVLGWVPEGRAVTRLGARAGDLCVVCGTIGDGWLGLKASRGEIADADGYLGNHYRLPEPLLALTPALRAHAHAAADVSDGLLADALHIAEASGLGLKIVLEAMPTSAAAAAWLNTSADPSIGRLALATGGDDYAILCAVSSGEWKSFAAQAVEADVTATVVGEFVEGRQFNLRSNGKTIDASRMGWRH